MNLELTLLPIIKLFCRTNLERKKGGLGKMKIPILSDITKQISKDYGILLEDQGVSLRSVIKLYYFQIHQLYLLEWRCLLL